MVCFRYITVNTLHKGGDDDDIVIIIIINGVGGDDNNNNFCPCHFTKVVNIRQKERYDTQDNTSLLLKSLGLVGSFCINNNNNNNNNNNIY